jgi:hypothetical protein
LLWYNHFYGVTSTNIFYIFNVYRNETSFYEAWLLCCF